MSPFDRASLDGAVAAAVERGIGVLAKRPLANAAWVFEEAPEAQDVRIYWDRMQAMAVDPSPLAWPELAVRFAAFAGGVSAALVGTSSAAHLSDAVAAVGRGALDEALLARLDHAWRTHGASWRGVI